jgi:glucose-6-phosphate-specific signal transduction histidine kinase
MTGQELTRKGLISKSISAGLTFVFQPRRLYPVTYGFIVFLLNQFATLTLLPSDFGPNLTTWLDGATRSLMDGALFALPLFFLNQTLKRLASATLKVVVYQVGVLTTAIIFAVVQGAFYDRGGTSIIFGISRIYLTIAGVSIFAGVVQNRLEKQMVRAEAAVLQIEKQRSLMLSAEESTRREVADFLHNRVQAGLVVTAMQLRITAAKVGGQLENELASIIEELESIRRLDVRAASRQLSPDFEILDLTQALTELGQIYAKSMEVKLQFDSPGQILTPELSLGIYRICEQALLNASVHGSATQSVIDLKINNPKTLTLNISNNGSWVTSLDSLKGGGSAIIDAWFKKYRGEWSIAQQSEGSVALVGVLRL